MAHLRIERNKSAAAHLKSLVANSDLHPAIKHLHCGSRGRRMLRQGPPGMEVSQNDVEPPCFTRVTPRRSCPAPAKP